MASVLARQLQPVGIHGAWPLPRRAAGLGLGWQSSLAPGPAIGAAAAPHRPLPRQRHSPRSGPAPTWPRSWGRQEVKIRGGTRGLLVAARPVANVLKMPHLAHTAARLSDLSGIAASR